MAEEKLKNFGELLKESMATRGEELPAVKEESSVTLSDAERATLLEKISQTKRDTTAQPPSAVDGQGDDLSTASFGVLLSKTVALQEDLKKDAHEGDDELREKILENSKMELAEELIKRFMR